MVRNYQILTITHRQTSLSDIGKFVISNAEGSVLQDRLTTLKAQFEVEELFYLATCNRVMYFFFTDQELTTNWQKAFFSEVNPQLDFENYYSKIKHYQGDDALQHLLKVAASIDSLVIGEREILRQLRESYDRCFEWGLTGDHLRLAFRLAIESGKEVYAKTKIGEKPISVVSLAIQKLREYHLPKDARILMVGAGQTNQLVAKFLKKITFGSITIFNRSLPKAQGIAEMLDGEAQLLSDLDEYKKGFDCLIVCTGATQSIINVDIYKKLLAGETNEKLVIDLSIPYNVSKEVTSQFPVRHIEIEGLKALAERNHDFRKLEIKKAKVLIDRQIEQFEQTYRQRQIAKAMSVVPMEIKKVKEKALNEVFHKDLEALDDSTRQLFETMLDYMEKKCIGIPMRAAKEAVV